MAHALALALAEGVEMLVILVGMAIYSNSIRRTAMFAAVQQSAPALLPTVQRVCEDETAPHVVWAPEGTPLVISQLGV